MASVRSGRPARIFEMPVVMVVFQRQASNDCVCRWADVNFCNWLASTSRLLAPSQATTRSKLGKFISAQFKWALSATNSKPITVAGCITFTCRLVRIRQRPSKVIINNIGHGVVGVLPAKAKFLLAACHLPFAWPFGNHDTGNWDWGFRWCDQILKLRAWPYRPHELVRLSS